MFKHKDLQTALRSLDATECERVVGSDGLRDPETARKFVEEIKHSGCLVVQWPDLPRQTQRDAFVNKCKELLAVADQAFLKMFVAHVGDAELAERGFHEIARSLDQCVIGQRAPDIQAWAAVQRACRELSHTSAEMEKQIKAQAESGEPLDPTRLRIRNENGKFTTPDAATTAITLALGNTLAMLAHKNGWFDRASPAVIVPKEVVVDDSMNYEAGTLYQLAIGWRRLERGWDRVRLFEADIRVREDTAPDTEGRIHPVQILEVSAPGKEEMMDRIAQDRFLQLLLQHQFDLDLMSAAKTAIQRPGATRVPLAPTAYVSQDEIAAYHLLAETFCLPVENEAELFEGLPLKVWLRGYAFYAQHLANSGTDECLFTAVPLALDDLTGRLESAGLTRIQAERFISLTTFGRKARDLFDTPLIRSADDRLYFFAPSYFGAVLCNIVLSRLGSLGVQFQKKGKWFETRIKDLFDKSAIPAHSFKYKIQGVEYDCDVAVLWDDTLFIFECKNYGMPNDHVPSLYHFLLGLDEFGEQVQRIAQHFESHPDIVRKHFGPSATWKKIEPCILQALPWSIGKLGDVYFYDASALTRFLTEGVITIKLPSKVAENVFLLRRHHIPLWRGSKPVAEDLRRELESPSQVRLQEQERSVGVTPVQVSRRMVISVPEWERHPIQVEKTLRALGSSAAEAGRIAREFEEFPDHVVKLRERLAAKVAGVSTDDTSSRPHKGKIGRNDPCPCGSGNKFKRCCGRARPAASTPI